MCVVIKRFLTPDFWSSHIQSGRTTRRSRMYSSTTRGRIHLLQFPHVHGIFPTDTNLLHYTPMEFDTETCNDKNWVKFLAVLLLWFGLDAYDWNKHYRDLDESCVFSESNNQLIPPNAFRLSHINHIHFQEPLAITSIKKSAHNHI